MSRKKLLILILLVLLMLVISGVLYVVGIKSEKITTKTERAVVTHEVIKDPSENPISYAQPHLKNFVFDPVYAVQSSKATIDNGEGVKESFVYKTSLNEKDAAQRTSDALTSQGYSANRSDLKKINESETENVAKENLPSASPSIIISASNNDGQYIDGVIQKESDLVLVSLTYYEEKK